MPLHVAPSTHRIHRRTTHSSGISSIGQQDVQLTPMQGAMIAAAVANQGRLMKPYLVDSGPGPRPDRRRQDRPGGDEPGRVSPRSPPQLTEMMTSVVDQRHRPQGPHPGRPGRRQDRDGARTPATDHAWFIGFAPADHPKIAVAVFVKNGGAHRRRHLRAGRPAGHPGLPRTGTVADGADHRQPAGRPLRDHRADRHRRHGRGVEGPRPGARPRSSRRRCCKSEYTGDPSFLARFRNEARHTAALTHPNIASVYDYGETVDDRAASSSPSWSWSSSTASRWSRSCTTRARCPSTGRCTCSASPPTGCRPRTGPASCTATSSRATCMVRPDGVVKLTDFGIAQARDATPLTRTGMVVGTAQYLSPEQAQGMEVTAASDVYSLGVVAYECLAGARPFDGASQVAIALAHINRPPPPLPADVPPAVRLLVERALAKDPADRFPDGGAFAEAIRRVAAGGTLAPPSVPGPAGARGTDPAPPVVGGAGVRRRHWPAAAVAARRRSPIAATQVIPATGPGARSPAGPPRPGPAAPMPPLQAPPDDDWLDDGRRRAAGGRGRGRWLWLAAARRPAAPPGRGHLVPAQRRQPRHRRRRRAAPAPRRSSARPDRHPARPGRTSSAARPTRCRPSWRPPGSPSREQDARTGAMLRGADTALDAGDVAGLDPSGVPGRSPATPVILYVARDGLRPRRASQAPTADRRRRPPPTTARRRTTTAASAPPHDDHARRPSTSLRRRRRPPSCRPRPPASASSPPPTDTGGRRLRRMGPA